MQSGVSLNQPVMNCVRCHDTADQQHGGFSHLLVLLQVVVLVQHTGMSRPGVEDDACVGVASHGQWLTGPAKFVG